MSVTLLEVWRAGRSRAAALAAESAGYLVLAAWEEMASMPRRMGLESLELQADGTLRISARETAALELSELDLREILAQLLTVASSAGPALVRVASRASHAPGTLALGAELEKALIPVNRAAARRALVRLYRETSRAIQAGRLAPSLPVPGCAPLSEGLPPSSAPDPAAFSEPPTPVLLPSPSPPPLPRFRSELEALTRPETVVARARAFGGSIPAPRPTEPPPVSVDTPTLGSVEVRGYAAKPAICVEERPRTEDSTERTPETADRFDTDIAELAGPQAFANTFGDAEGALDAASIFESSAAAPAIRELDEERAAAEVEVDPEPLELVPVVEGAPRTETAAVQETPPMPVVSEPVSRAEAAQTEAAPQLVSEAMTQTEAQETLPPAEVVPYAGLPAERSEVRVLLEGFQVALPTNEVNLRKELSALAGVDLTPGSSSEVRVR
jgi:hypothetical protein